MESESRFRTLAESAPVGIVISNRDEETLYVNQRFTDLFGYTLADMPGGSMVAPCLPGRGTTGPRPTRWTAAVEQAAGTNTPIDPLEYPVTCKDGGVRQVEFQLTSTGDLNFVLLSDVTRRREAEQAVREGLENLRITLNSIGDAVIATDLEGRVRRMNPVAEVLTGWTFAQAENQPVEDIFHIVDALTGETW